MTLVGARPGGRRSTGWGTVAGRGAPSGIEDSSRRRVAPPTRARSSLEVLLTTTASDAHTWNLIYLQMVLEELGNRVVNLGPCVPDDCIVSEGTARRPDLIVISSVNGHGLNDGLRIIRLLRTRAELASTVTIIGGKLHVTGAIGPAQAERLLAAGFDAVFGEGGDPAAVLRSYVWALQSR